MKTGPITGTFIDQISYDLPSLNFSREQWSQEFDYMKAFGIDTLVFIRGGMGDKTIFPSKTIGSSYCPDIARICLEEAEKRDMKVYMGLYMSDLEWGHGDWKTELRMNKPFIDELYERYKSFKSFVGFYYPHETPVNEGNITKIFSGLGQMCKDKDPSKKILISPFFKSEIFKEKYAITPEENFEIWDEIFAKSGHIDHCAFQDGTAPFYLMDDYYMGVKKLCDKYNIDHWVNTETFSRGPGAQFLSVIDFYELQRKLKHHEAYADKIITFEFSHFLSPQSINLAAHNLHRLYSDEYLK